jgi:hypothetical protein
MPFIGLGLINFIFAIFFAVHAMRTGRPMYWLLILLMFPGLGSIVYFFAEYLPSSRMEYTVRKTVVAAAKSLDPGRELREARQAFELVPTAQNQMRLASALLEAGDAGEAAKQYESCLQGPFASDPDIRFGAARARLENGDAAGAITLLETIRKEKSNYRTEQLSILLAQSYAKAGRSDAARTEFQSAVANFDSVNAHAEYAIWAIGAGQTEIADAQYREIERLKRHWTKHAYTLNRPLMDRLESAFAQRKSSGT